MAVAKNRRTARLPKTGTFTGMNATNIQRRVLKFLRKPMARYILGGVAVTALAPVIMRIFRNEDVKSFVSDNVDTIRTRIDGYIHSAESEMDSLN